MIFLSHKLQLDLVLFKGNYTGNNVYKTSTNIQITLHVGNLNKYIINVTSCVIKIFEKATTINNTLSIMYHIIMLPS